MCVVFCLILNTSFHSDHLTACTLGSLNYSSFSLVKRQCVCGLGLEQEHDNKEYQLSYFKTK